MHILLPAEASRAPAASLSSPTNQKSKTSLEKPSHFPLLKHKNPFSQRKMDFYLLRFYSTLAWPL